MMGKMKRRSFLGLAAGAVAMPALPRVARAQAYPSRSVRIIVGTAAGGGMDIAGRVIAQALTERLGQQFFVEDRPGAGTNVGTELVVRSTPDGYTLLLSSAANAINATLYQNLNFNFIRDVAPVATIARVPQVMEVHPSVPAKPFQSLSPMRRRTRTKSTWPRPATAACSRSPASCSR